MTGEVGGKEINQTFLLFTTVYIMIPSFMVFLSLVLKPAINRLTNIVVALVYAISILSIAIIDKTEVWLYYRFSNIVEVVLLFLIVWYAWKWPRQGK